MRMARLAFGLLAVVCLLGLGREARSQDEKGVYTITIHKLEVEKTNSKGASWDLNNGRPDLAVTVRNYSEKDSKSFTTKTKDDTFVAEFNEPTTVKFRIGQTIEFHVVDKDVTGDDTIGKLQQPFNKKIFRVGKHEFKFGRVKSLLVSVNKLAADSK